MEREPVETVPETCHVFVVNLDGYLNTKYEQITISKLARNPIQIILKLLQVESSNLVYPYPHLLNRLLMHLLEPPKKSHLCSEIVHSEAIKTFQWRSYGSDSETIEHHVLP